MEKMLLLSYDRRNLEVTIQHLDLCLERPTDSFNVAGLEVKVNPELYKEILISMKKDKEEELKIVNKELKEISSKPYLYTPVVNFDIPTYPSQTMVSILDKDKVKPITGSMPAK